jgi:hypothetical protein
LAYFNLIIVYDRSAIRSSCDTYGSVDWDYQSGLLYLAKSFYCINSTGECVVADRPLYPKGSRYNYSDAFDDNDKLMVTITATGLFPIRRSMSPASNNTSYKIASSIGQIELSTPKNGVFIEEVSLDLPNAEQIFQNVKSKGFMEVLGSEYINGLSKQYYSLLI